jgi:broad specificity phosphatase PhoE
LNIYVGLSNTTPQKKSLCGRNAKAAHIESCAVFFQSLSSSQKITMIYTSPLIRCRETAAIVSERLGGIPIQVREGLKEIYYGDWSAERRELTQQIVDQAIAQGLDDIAAKRDVFVQLGLLQPPDDAEPWGDFKVRARRGVEQCLNESNNVLIVGHGALFKVFLENKKLYDKGSDYWTLTHRPPLILEFSSPEDTDNWGMTTVSL